MGHAGGVNTSVDRISRGARARVRAGIAAAALATLAGCAGPAPVVTVTVPSPAASDPAASPGTPSDPGKPSSPAEPSTPAKPAPATTPAPGSGPTPGPLPTVGPGGASIVVTQGPVAPECTKTVCYLVHVTWTNLKPGAHDTQCVSDHSDPPTWSQSTYKYATADGERDLGCFLGKPGSRVWVVIDGTFESPHAAWG